MEFVILYIAERFTVASYNILADRNASWHKDLYSNVPYSYMNWDRRKRVICKELIGWNPDIICLQVRIFLFIYFYFFVFLFLFLFCVLWWCFSICFGIL